MTRKHWGYDKLIEILEQYKAELSEDIRCHIKAVRQTVEEVKVVRQTVEEDYDDNGHDICCADHCCHGGSCHSCGNDNHTGA